jgi:predicted Zn finger-like uncharacterized protein
MACENVTPHCSVRSAIGSMQIVCPHCSTSYAIKAESFGTAGRTVRCARCKETWLAYPEEVAAAPQVFAPTVSSGASEWDEPPADNSWGQTTMPVVESPSISSELPDHTAQDREYDEQTDFKALAEQGDKIADSQPRRRTRPGLSTISPGPLAHSSSKSRPARYGRAQADTPASKLQIACVTMGAIALGLMIWRTDIVRLLPQTAPFFKMVGFSVNLRGLAFEDVRVSTELVDNKPVLIIEGNIVDTTKKTLEIPRLRFLVRDANGTEIYAWNAVLEQSVLNPGEKAWFKSRLASPPAEGREIAIRFFNKRDIRAGGV